MKTIFIVSLALLIVSCATTPSHPPKQFETGLYNITTNWESGWETNSIKVTNDGVVSSIDLPIPVRIPHYVYTPNTNATAIVDAGRGIGNIFGVGELIALALGSGIGLYGQLRSSRASKAATTAQQTSIVLAQVIETGRKLLATTPQGQKVEEEWVKWMMKHQAEAGVFDKVVELLKTAVDAGSAQKAAEELAAKVTEPPAE